MRTATLSALLLAICSLSAVAWAEDASPAPVEFVMHRVGSYRSEACDVGDADGDLDLVTGKRFMAHNGTDPGENDPPCVYWYELQRGRTVKWVRHPISVGQGIGSGMSIPVVDLDADGDLDIVVTGKFAGPVWFENRRITSQK